MRIGSLFSGIGGLELGLEWAGIGHTVWQCEIDPFCRAVLAKHWPNVERFEDVTRPRTWPAADLICGGFPCQDVSDAGARKGLAGERSGLWRYFADVVERVSPAWVVVENVAQGAPRLWLPTVRRDLCRMGYRARAFALSAADIGAPHLRRRVFVVATNAHGKGKHALSFNAEVASTPPPADPGAEGRERSGPEAHEGWPGPAADPWRAPVSGLVPVVHGLSGGLAGRRRRARIRSLGNSVVPQCAETVGRMIRAMLLPGTAPEDK